MSVQERGKVGWSNTKFVKEVRNREPNSVIGSHSIDLEKLLYCHCIDKGKKVAREGEALGIEIDYLDV